jgi:ribosomal protein L15
MSKFPWKTTLAVSALLAATAYAFAQMSSGSPMGMHGQMHGEMDQTHSQMMQNQGGMHGGAGGMGMHGGDHHGMHGQQSNLTGAPTMPGQDAFGAIQEVVQILQTDPKTDWSKVNIGALRQHLIDMNEVTLRAAVAPRVLENGVEFTVTGEGRTLEAIKRMVPAHVKELHEIGWNAKTDELPNGVKLTILAGEAQSLTKLKALGFMGIMVQGGHHKPHHLMMATGQFVH